jgi:polysaccharide biosynthesis/export protein
MSSKMFPTARTARLLLAAALLPAMYGQTGQSAQQKDTPPGPAPAAAASPQSAPADSAPPPEYILQAGDEMDIRVYNLPELAQKVKVRPDGRISLMLLDEVVAAGSTATSLSETIRKGYSTQFRNPRVTVVVTSFVNQNIYVGGEVLQPRLIALNGRLSAAAAVFYAGGLKNTAKTKEIIILRNSGKNSAQLTRLNLEEVLTKGAPDIELQPFDVVFVPKTRIAKLDQFVDQYIKLLQPVALNLGFSYLLGGQTFQVAIP